MKHTTEYGRKYKYDTFVFDDTDGFLKLLATGRSHIHYPNGFKQHLYYCGPWRVGKPVFTVVIQNDMDNIDVIKKYAEKRKEKEA